MRRRLKDAVRKDPNLLNTNKNVRDVRSDLNYVREGLRDSLKERFEEAALDEAEKKVNLELGDTLEASGAGGTAKLEAPKPIRPWAIGDLPDRNGDDLEAEWKWRHEVVQDVKTVSLTLKANIDRVKTLTTHKQWVDYYKEILERSLRTNTDRSVDLSLIDEVAEAHAWYETNGVWIDPSAPQKQKDWDADREKALSAEYPVEKVVDALNAMTAHSLVKEWQWLDVGRDDADEIANWQPSRLKQRYTEIQDRLRSYELLIAFPEWTADAVQQYDTDRTNLCEELQRVELALVWALGMNSAEIAHARQVLQHEGAQFYDRYTAAQDAAFYEGWTWWIYTRQNLKALMAVGRSTFGQGKALKQMSIGRSRSEGHLQLTRDFQRKFFGDRVRKGLERAVPMSTFRPHVVKLSDNVYKELLDPAEFDRYKKAGFFGSCAWDTSGQLLTAAEDEIYTQQKILRNKASPRRRVD